MGGMTTLAMKMLIMYSACNRLISLGTEYVIPTCNSESECHSHIWPTLRSEITLVLTVHMQDPPSI
jgi:hypothetical protein